MSVLTELNTNIPDGRKKELETKISVINESLAELKKEQKEASAVLAQKCLMASLSTAEGGVSLLAEFQNTPFVKESGELILNLSSLSSFIDMTGGVISLVFQARKAIDKSDQLENLERNINILTDAHKNEGNPQKAIILRAKLEFLQNLRDELRVELGKSVIATTTSGLALSASVKGVLAACGIALGTTAATTLAATGAGAVVIGAGLAVAGGAEYIYNQPEEIRSKINTLDIPARLFLNRYELGKEIELYKAAEKQFDAVQADLEKVRFLLDDAYRYKDQTDSLKGPGSLEKQAEATKQVVEFSVFMEKKINEAADCSAKVLQSMERIKALKDKIQYLENREEKEEDSLRITRLTKLIRNYNLHTLVIMEDIINEALQSEDESLGNGIKDLMKQYGFSVIEPLDYPQVLEFISEKEMSSSQTYEV